MSGLSVPAVPATPVEAAEFVRWCVEAIGLGFHPDTSGAQYVVLATGAPTFSEPEAERFDAALDAAHDLLGDVYATTTYYVDLADRQAAR